MSGIANTNEFRPATVRRSQNRELGNTEMGINEESTQNSAPLPSTEMLKDSELNSIANSQSRTMAKTEAEFRRQNILDNDLHDGAKFVSYTF